MKSPLDAPETKLAAAVAPRRYMRLLRAVEVFVLVAGVAVGVLLSLRYDRIVGEHARLLEQHARAVRELQRRPSQIMPDHNAELDNIGVQLRLTDDRLQYLYNVAEIYGKECNPRMRAHMPHHAPPGWKPITIPVEPKSWRKLTAGAHGD